MALPLAGTPVILDIGSAYTKIGFAGEPGPRFVFPTITGKEKYKSVMVDVSARSSYVGSDAAKMRGVLKIKRPIERGAIMDWDDYYEILNYCFYSLLRIPDLSQYPILYTEPPFLQKETKEYIARVLFETHRIKSLFMVPTPILSMFSAGLTSGLVVESGDGITWICPIINGQIIDQAVKKLTLGSSDVNQYLKNLLMREGIHIESSAVDEIVKDIKEKNCYFILDPENVKDKDERFKIVMPDGSSLSIPHYIFHEAPEVLFQPNLIGYPINNIPQAIIECLQGIDKYYWSELLSHLIISGGNLSYSGFEERLRLELVKLLPQLGKIPKPKKEPTKSKQKSELKPIEGPKKKKDTCPHCGAILDLSDEKELCPSCGGRIKLPSLSIKIDNSNKKRTIINGKLLCPHCGKEIKDISSVFCPYCGKDVEIEELDNEAKKTAPEPPPAKEFSGFYDNTEEVLNFFVPENLQYAIFNGAAILGTLSSFQNLFITHEQFLANKELLYKDISEIF